ncbi:RING/U-box superfamily protein [Rhynchospora pubera]|uniref:RING-type E3 ubiquitin transferase n=1 Tax=Rhynchospora pubera TaxID=906938 RepID=A0AAV8DA46_9POAL|nr:RING/U-box superfamily protein [Rhynchospora pubera]
MRSIRLSTMLIFRRHLLFLLYLVSVKSTCAQVQPTPPSNDFNTILTIGVLMMLFIIVVATFGIFLLFIYRFWNLPLATFLGGDPETTDEFSKRKKGIDKSVLETLPILVFAKLKEHLIGKGSLDCAVCLTEFDGDDMLRLLPACNHMFHLDCIDTWLEYHVTCPLCRCNLMPNLEVSVTIDCSTIRSDDAVGNDTIAARETVENHEHLIFITAEQVIEMRSHYARLPS